MVVLWPDAVMSKPCAAWAPVWQSWHAVAPLASRRAWQEQPLCSSAPVVLVGTPEVFGLTSMTCMMLLPWHAVHAELFVASLGSTTW